MWKSRKTWKTRKRNFYSLVWFGCFKWVATKSAEIQRIYLIPFFEIFRKILQGKAIKPSSWSVDLTITSRSFPRISSYLRFESGFEVIVIWRTCVLQNMFRCVFLTKLCVKETCFEVSNRIILNIREVKSYEKLSLWHHEKYCFQLWYRNYGKDKKQCWPTMKSHREIAEKAREQE